MGDREEWNDVWAKWAEERIAELEKDRDRWKNYGRIRDDHVSELEAELAKQMEERDSANALAASRGAEVEQATEHLRLRNQYPEDFDCYKALEKAEAEVERLKEQQRSFETMAADWSRYIGQLQELLKRYRTEVPLGHQPHMIAHEVDEALNGNEK